MILMTRNLEDRQKMNRCVINPRNGNLIILYLISYSTSSDSTSFSSSTLTSLSFSVSFPNNLNANALLSNFCIMTLIVNGCQIRGHTSLKQGTSTSALRMGFSYPSSHSSK